MAKYMACCTHPTCPAKEGCIHCNPHPFDENECAEVCCGMLEEPSKCDIVEMVDANTVRTVRWQW